MNYPGRKNVKRITMSSLALLLSAVGCQKQGPKADFTTPEGAILVLEEAYRRKDLEAAVAAKDFVTEARIMLTQARKGMEQDAAVLKETAEVLELGFRLEMKNGFPDFAGLKSQFPQTEKYENFDDVVVVTEVCTFPDGGTSQQKLLVARTTGGWRVLNVIK
jgi:hypothetical protein